MSNPLAGLPTCTVGQCSRLVGGLVELKARYDRDMTTYGETQGRQLLELYRRACSRAGLPADLARRLDAELAAEVQALIDGTSGE